MPLCRTAACAVVAVALFARLALYPAHAQQRDRAADVIALTVCVIDADIRWAALARMARGDGRAATLAALADAMPDSVYQAQAERLVDEVFRVRPTAPRPYVAGKLESCTAQATPEARAGAADGCYQLTRYANDFFAARAAGVALADSLARLHELARAQGLSDDAEGRLAKLAASVYATTVTAPQFRSGLFFHCVMPARFR